MVAPVRSDDVIALMLPAWGPLLEHKHGRDVVTPGAAKRLRGEIRDAYQELARAGRKVTADDLRGAVERRIREHLAPFEDRIPSPAEVAALPSFVRERYEDYQRVREEARLRGLAEVNPFPDGIVSRKYLRFHLEMKQLELGEKLIQDHDLIDASSKLLRVLKGRKNGRVLQDGTTVRCVTEATDDLRRTGYVGGLPALEIARPDGSKLYVDTKPRFLGLARGWGTTTYVKCSAGEEQALRSSARGVSRYQELKMSFLQGVDVDALAHLAIAIDASKTGGKNAAAIEEELARRRRDSIMLWGQYLVRSEWPSKLSEIADHLRGGRTMKVDGDRVRFSIKEKVDLALAGAGARDEKKVTLREGGPFIHVRDTHGNRDFLVSIPALAERRLDLVLVGDRREAEHVEVAADGTVKDPENRRLPALENLDEAVRVVWARIRGLDVEPWKDAE